MSGTVIILPVVERPGPAGERAVQVQVPLTAREFRWLCEIAGTWKVEPRQAATDLLATAIRQAAGKSVRR